jgi:predicted cupin superfamily sugar epimerase
MGSFDEMRRKNAWWLKYADSPTYLCVSQSDGKVKRRPLCQSVDVCVGTDIKEEPHEPPVIAPNRCWWPGSKGWGDRKNETTEMERTT